MRGIDLTKGPVVHGVLAFALPLLVTSVVQQLYTTVDLLFVGNVLGTASLAALGVGALLVTILAGAFTGVSVGVNVKVGQLFGAGDEGMLGRALSSSVVLAAAVGVGLVLAGEALAGSFIMWMAVPAESASQALTYVQFAVAAALPIALYNAAAGALRGLGDSRSPLVAQLVGGVCNIGANWFALCVLGWGIAGCAFATFASNGVAAGIALAYLVRKDAYPHGEAGAGIDWGFARFLLVFGVPIAVQTVAITLSNVAVQYQIDLLGVQSIAAFSIYLKVELPIYFVILAIGHATTTFVAQNHGAGLRERCIHGGRVCQVLCLGLTVLLSAVMLAVGYWAFWIFDRSEDVIALGLLMIFTTFPFYFLYAVLEVQADTMRGYGHSLAPALAVLANICILRVVLVFAASAYGLGLQAIAATYPITWGTAALCVVALRSAFIHRRTREAF